MNTAEANEASRATASRKVGAKAHQAADKLTDATANAEQAWEEMQHKLHTQSQELSDNVADYVRKKPFAALGFAALAGAVLVTLLRK